MDGNRRLEPKDEDSLTSQDINEKCYIERIKNTGRSPGQDGAGPSTDTAIVLPGSTELSPTSVLAKTIRSKSEHDIRHIFTTDSVANALKFATINLEQHNTYKNVPSNDFPTVHQTKKDIQITAKDLQDLMMSICNIIGPKDVANLHNANASLIDENRENRPMITAMTIVPPLPTTPTITLTPLQNNLTPINVVKALPNPLPIEPPLPKVDVDTGNDKKKIYDNVSIGSEYPVAARDSLSSIGSNVCRICMTRGRERLISPCNCKGSLANVHLSCLERWLNQVGRNHCELCGYRYYIFTFESTCPRAIGANEDLQLMTYSTRHSMSNVVQIGVPQNSELYFNFLCIFTCFVVGIGCLFLIIVGVISVLLFEYLWNAD